MEISEAHCSKSNLIVIDGSANGRIRFFICPMPVRDSAEEIGDWYISWLRTNTGFSGTHRRFSLRFFEENRTVRPWEHDLRLTEKGCVEMGCREIPFIERIAFIR